MCDDIHKSFDMVGDGSEQLRVDEEYEHYIANWNTRNSGAEAGQFYRVRMTVNGVEHQTINRTLLIIHRNQNAVISHICTTLATDLNSMLWEPRPSTKIFPAGVLKILL